MNISSRFRSIRALSSFQLLVLIALIAALVLLVRWATRSHQQTEGAAWEATQ